MNFEKKLQHMHSLQAQKPGRPPPLLDLKHFHSHGSGKWSNLLTIILSIHIVVVNIKICLKTLLANHHERRRNCGVQYLTFKKNIDNKSYVLLVLLLKIDIDDKSN